MHMLTVTHLTANLLAEPLGVLAPLELGWQLQSDCNDVMQSACRVQIALKPAFASVWWDSGELPHTDSAHYYPVLPRMEDARRYWWRVWVQAGGMEAWSDPASFVTGLREGFGAQMITAETPEAASSDRGTAVWQNFAVDGEVEAAYVYATALGLYQLRLDGERVSDLELTPGWTSYHKHLLYQTYDVTALLSTGEHTLGVWLGSGWYKGLMGLLYRRNNYGKHAAFLCQLELRYRDGRRQTIRTDADWRGADTPVLFADIYNGETCDARITPENERPVQTLPFDYTALTPQAGGAVRIADTIPARSVFVTPKGEQVVDFGQNMAGFIRFTVRGNAGDVAELRCFEVLDQEGNVYTANLRTARQTLRYTLRGGEAETYQPHFTFQGFRYAHIVSWPGTPAKEAFTACALHSDMSPTGSFSCSEPMVNQLWHNILWGMKSNFVDVPTDCPQRDERLGWTGDAQMFSATACYLMNANVFFRKWLRDVAADQNTEGGVPHVVPDTITGRQSDAFNWLLHDGSHSAAAWADAAVIIPWNLYLAYGDRTVLETQYGSMKNWVDFMRAHADGCQWHYRLQFGDWVALDAQEGSYYGATPNDLICTAYFAYSSGLLSKAASALGKAEDAAAYDALRAQIAAFFQTTYFDQNDELTVQTQTAHVLALHFSLTPDRAKTLTGLKRLMDARGGHLSTGFVGTPYIAHALSDSGALEDAYALVLKKDYPSWLYQVTMGATTIWEHWDGIKPDGSLWSADMNSFNHYAYGAVGEWLYKVVGGIRSDEAAPGYRHAILAPCPGGGLTHAEASLQTVYGLLSLAWQAVNGALRMDVTVPCNTTATLRVPPGYAGEARELCSGAHTVILPKIE
jgi:alpha-L-rhamnosidase